MTTNLGRPSSLGTTAEQEKLLEAAQQLKSQLEAADLLLLRHRDEFQSYKDDGLDPEEFEFKDPAIIASDVASQTSFLRKLKFQYLEQNAKDRYVKSIVSDIDDAPIVTADDNKALLAINAEKKEKLKVSKAKLAKIQQNTRVLAPTVEEKYQRIKEATEQASNLAQKIIDARLTLSRLRKTHPNPRLTIVSADQKLLDQVNEMQTLSDELDALNKDTRAMKETAKAGALELENLRAERAEVEKALKSSRVDEDDGRLIPLYDWYTASMDFHRTMNNLHESHAVSDNELRLTYRIDLSRPNPYYITITLIFAPDTRNLAAVQTLGLDTLGVDLGDLTDAHIQVNDVHGLVSAILARARAANL